MLKTSYLNAFYDINWQNDEDIPSCDIKRWLTDKGLLTPKLKSISDEIYINKINCGWEREERLFGFDDSRFWIRDVLITAKDGEKHCEWVVARSVFPSKTTEAMKDKILDLNNRPLGDLLSCENAKRVELSWGLDSKSGLYARKSVFDIRGFRLGLCELFLHDFSFPVS